MDKNEKVIEMVEAENNSQENPETKGKKRFRDTKVGGFVYRHRKPILITLAAVTTLAGGAAVKAYKDKKDADAAHDEEEQAQLAEDWYNRSLLEAHESSPEPIDVECAPAETEV